MHFVNFTANFYSFAKKVIYEADERGFRPTIID